MRRTNRKAALGLGLGLCCGVVASLTGCAQPRNTLPATVEVELPDGSTVTVEQGSGVTSLANSSWALTDGNGNAVLTIVFGADGELTTFENNTIASDILGSTLLFDGQPHSTGIDPVSYTAATFGAETSTGTGFAFTGLLSASVPIIGTVGSGSASASGTLDENDDNVMTGTLSYEFEVNANLPFEIPIAVENLSGEIEFVATRVE